jgi:hypothetical protein
MSKYISHISILHNTISVTQSSVFGGHNDTMATTKLIMDKTLARESHARKTNASTV